MFETIQWKNNAAILIDQRKLPREEIYLTIKTPDEMAHAIKDMVVRGAPAIGVSAAFGIALAVVQSQAKSVSNLLEELDQAYDLLFKTRPTAVNLGWALKRMKAFWTERKNQDLTVLKKEIVGEALLIHAEDIQINQKIGQNGAVLLNDGDTVLNHCNAGALATAGHGTSLGVIYSAQKSGKKIHAFVDETRPFLQGARLSAWELQKNGVPVTLITDNMAGWFMKKGAISKVIVGADRIAANGDTANKIGTYSVAVLAQKHKIPFYVAAPLSTIDLQTAHGDLIPIEERSTEEVTHIAGIRIAPEGIAIRNPAFDVTPAELITAMITEKGIVYPDFLKNLKEILHGSKS